MPEVAGGWDSLFVSKRSGYINLVCISAIYETLRNTNLNGNGGYARVILKEIDRYYCGFSRNYRYNLLNHLRECCETTIISM